MVTVLLWFVFGVMTVAAQDGIELSRPIVFQGACDASAGAALTDDLFAAADDELNRIRVYSLSRGGAPLAELALDRFLEVDRREPEADIEGAARVADMIYWIGSHARNQRGKVRQSRQRLFATRIASANTARLEPFGRPYGGLLADLEAAPQLMKFDLELASELGPKEKSGLNIEGLCARPDGTLLIGFRNPVPKKKALLVPLLNAEELVRAGGKARFGDPIRLDLGGRGIRDMVLRDNEYFIVAGAYDSADKFELYRWNGREELSLLHKWRKHTLNPEAILALPGKSELLLLTDESGKDCRTVPPPNRQFRGVLIERDVAAGN